MLLISNILLVAGALGLALYCIVLSRRLRRFSDLEKGVGGAIAVLSAQVDDMTKTLQAAQQVAASSTTTLDRLTERAEGASKRLEILVASLHDLPDPAEALPRRPAKPAAPAPDKLPVEALFLSHRSRVRGERS